MFLMVFFELQKFVSGFLSEEFNCYPLVVHSYFRLLSNISSCKSITNTSWPIFIFLDSIHELMTSFHINLSSLYDFLENLCVLSCEFLHFSLLVKVFAAAFFLFKSGWVVSIDIIFDWNSNIFTSYFFKACVMLVKRLKTFELVEKVTSLNNHLLGLSCSICCVTLTMLRGWNVTRILMRHLTRSPHNSTISLFELK